jgi:hypothetical protein
MENAPTEYDAQGEYSKEVKLSMRPRNYSPRVAHRFRDSISAAMQNDPELIAELQPGYTDRVKHWSASKVDDRLAMVGRITDMAELRAAMIVEEDPDVLSVMAERVAELKGKTPKILK